MDTIQMREGDLVLLGYKGKNGKPEAFLGTVLPTDHMGMLTVKDLVSDSKFVFYWKHIDYVLGQRDFLKRKHLQQIHDAVNRRPSCTCDEED